MASTFFGLDIALSGLNATQAQLATVSHNIANAETKGYSKQSVITHAGEPLRNYSKAGMTGTGVVATGIVQERSLYYDEKYWKSSSIQGEYETVDKYLSSVENYLNETQKNGFTTIFDDLFNAISNMSNDASSLEKRTAVAERAETFTEYMNTLYKNLQGVQNDLNVEIKNQVDRVNSIAKEISSLNLQISTLEVDGGAANDLRDQRALLIDELSGYGTVEVSEKILNKTERSTGQESYTVKFNGQILVNTEENRQLKCVPRNFKTNQNDIAGLYDIVWEDSGEELNIFSNNSYGSIDALMKVRDGNNQANLTGTVNASIGDNTITFTNTNINEISKLNAPEEGYITIGGNRYQYTDFTVNIVNNGGTNEYQYTFNLSERVDKNLTNRSAQIGESINFKGVAHYMTEMNEFLRTFSSEFNTLHNTGLDLEGNTGLDFFVYNDDVTGSQNQMMEIKTLTGFSSSDVSYYKMTAGNSDVLNSILEDPNTIAAADNIVEGNENNNIIAAISKLKSDEGMFKQGKPAAFLDSVVAEIGVDKQNYKKLAANQKNITNAVDTQRLSISSVDVDEEGLNLVKYQKAYELSGKVFTIMNEIYDKLINEMGA